MWIEDGVLNYIPDYQFKLLIVRNDRKSEELKFPSRFNFTGLCALQRRMFADRFALMIQGNESVEQFIAAV